MIARPDKSLVRLVSLPPVRHRAWIHRDPFDRLLVMQAQLEGLRLFTADRRLLGYGEGVCWVG